MNPTFGRSTCGASSGRRRCEQLTQSERSQGSAAVSWRQCRCFQLWALLQLPVGWSSAVPGAEM